jgi:hypothetical protein
MFTTNDPYAHLRSKVSSDPAEGEVQCEELHLM